MRREMQTEKKRQRQNLIIIIAYPSKTHSMCVIKMYFHLPLANHALILPLPRPQFLRTTIVDSNQFLSIRPPPPSLFLKQFPQEKLLAIEQAAT